MDDNSKIIYQLNAESMEKMLRKIIQSEFKILEERLKKEPKVLSRQEAADMLGYSPNTISEFIKKDLLPNRGMGRKIMILESDLVKIPKKRGFNFDNGH